MKAFAIALAIVLYSAGAAWNYGSFNRLERARERYQPRFVVLPRTEVVKLASLGFEALASDWYWILGVNYFGDARNAQVGYAELSNYLELVTDLDPKFFPAYLFGGYMLPWVVDGKWVNIEEAAELLEKGIREFPNDWRLHFQVAYLYSAHLKRFKDAGDHLVEASRLPNAPPYLPTLATRMYVSDGSVNLAEAMAQKLVEHAQHPWERELALKRLRELRALSLGRALTDAVSAFKAAQGRLPESLAELAGAGTSVPPEPLGGEWIYDPSTGEVSSSALKDDLKIRIHPRDRAEQEQASREEHGD